MNLRTLAVLAALSSMAAVAAAATGSAPTAPATSAVAVDVSALRAQVTATEQAFARSMAQRDARAFATYVADDAVFFRGSGTEPLRGRAEVVAHWQRFFDGPKAPFSWAPDEVEVLASGQLAHSSGPVHDADGHLVGRFNTVWKQESPGVWRVVFDKGEDICTCAKQPAKP